jgi:hypothetical protein
VFSESPGTTRGLGWAGLVGGLSVFGPALVELAGGCPFNGVLRNARILSEKMLLLNSLVLFDAH